MDKIWQNASDHVRSDMLVWNCVTTVTSCVIAWFIWAGVIERRDFSWGPAGVFSFTPRWPVRKSQEYTVFRLWWSGKKTTLTTKRCEENREKRKRTGSHFAAWLHCNWGTCERGSSEWTSSVNRGLKCWNDTCCAQEKQSPWLSSEWCVPHEYLHHAQPSFFVRPCTSRDSL